MQNRRFPGVRRFSLALACSLLVTALLQGCGGGGGGGTSGEALEADSTFGRLVWGSNPWLDSK